MFRKLTPIIVLTGTVLLSGCLSTYTYHAENVRACKVEAGSVWKGDSTNLSLKRDDVSYSFYIRDDGSNNAEQNGTRGTFFLSVYGATVGKAVGMRAPEMLYDPRTASIEIKGKKIHAMPIIWEAHLVNGYYRPTLALPIPTNLNVLGRPVPQNFFIGFKMDDPSPHDTYRINAGTILLDGVETALPTFLSCYTEGYGKWYPIH